MKIGDKKVEKWRQTGLVVKENLLAAEELKQAQTELPDGAAAGALSFPFTAPGLNQVALHPEFLSLAERALSTGQPLLVSSDVVAFGDGDGAGFDSAWAGLDLVVAPPADPGQGLIVTIVPYGDLTAETVTVEVFTVADGEVAAEPEVVTAPSGSAIVLRGDTRYRLRGGAGGSGQFAHVSVWCAAERLDVPRRHHLRPGAGTEAFLAQASREQLAAVAFPLDTARWPAGGSTEITALAPAAAPAIN